MSLDERGADESAEDDLSPRRHAQGRRDDQLGQQRHSFTSSVPTSTIGTDDESDFSTTSMARKPATRYGKIFKRFVVDFSRGPKAEKLEASFIGASFWSAEEKAVFFEQLDVHSRHDPAAIASATDNKSTVEVREYIVALQEGSEDAVVEPLDHEAAVDISAACEDAMDQESTMLEKKIFKKLCQVEQELYGDDWLIDVAEADVIEEALADSLEPDEANTSEFPAEELLSPAALLEVSRNVFMNDGSDPAACYDTLELQHEGTNGPAMFRSAFEILHHICVEYTKRLVAAAHFQALSRIRARKDTRIQQAVRQIDVDTALSIMNVPKADARSYWAKKVQQYHLNVYSESREYADGRIHKRNHGYLLTDSELMKELQKGAAVQDQDDHKLEDDSTTQAPESEDSIDEWEDDDDDDDQHSEDSDASRESDDDDETEKQDQIDSRLEENALRELLNMPPLPTKVEGKNLRPERTVISGARSTDTSNTDETQSNGTRKRKRAFS